MNSSEETDGANSQEADAMILELEALMADVDKAQRRIDHKKGSREEGPVVVTPVAKESSAIQAEDIETRLAAAAASADDAPSDPESIFRELEGLTSMMDSVTRSLITARDGSHDDGAGEEPADCAQDDEEALPLTTSFMSSSGALPPGATAVDFNPLSGSAAASLTVSQLSNEGLASSVEGLNISQISNEGMATSAIIDAAEVPIVSPTSPSESPNEETSNVVEAPEQPVVASEIVPEAPSEAPPVPEEHVPSEPSTPKTEALPPVLDPVVSSSAAKGAKKKAASPVASVKASSSSSSGKSGKKSGKKAASPALVNGEPTEPVIVKETPEGVMKGLSNLPSVEAKLKELTNRHAAVVTQYRESEYQNKLEQRRALTALKEKEIINIEHQKTLLAKSKLESLCRELQKHSKMVKDEAMKRAQIEEAKRKEVADSFQSTIEEVTNRMQSNSERNNSLRDQNEELATKMKTLVEQYEKREDHVEKILKHKDLELQLSQAKLDKAEAEKKELVEKSNKEREILLGQTLESVKKTQMMEQNEKHLRAQIELYTEKYDEFQSTLSKSNTVFNNFKSEMAQMTKKIKKLEKEIQMWKGRWENSNSQLEKVSKEKEGADADLKEAKSKINKLEKLCRALQQERHSLTTQMSKLQPGKDALGNDVSTSSDTIGVDNASDSVAKQDDAINVLSQ